MKYKFWILNVFFTLFSVFPLFATKYNVSNAAQVTTIMSSVTAGDTLVMANGVWTNQLINFGGKNGTASKPIVLMAQTAGNVLLEGTSRLRIYGNYLVVHGLKFQNADAVGFGTNSVVEFRNGSTLANFSKLSHCYFYYYNAANVVDNKWVSLYGTNNTVEYCRFEGKSNYGATVTVWYQATTSGFPAESPSTFHKIDHNYFLDRTLLDGGTNGGESIRVGDSNTSRTDGYNVISSNLFKNCDGEIEVVSNKSEFNTYEYNTFIGNAGGLTLRHGANCTVRGNFFFGDNDPLSAGVRLIDGLHKVYNNYFQGILGGSGSSLRSAIVVMSGQATPAANGYWPVYDAAIFHNTIINCATPSVNIGSVSQGGTVVPTDVSFANNLIKSDSSPLVNYAKTPTNMSYEGNIYDGTSLGIPSPTGWLNVEPKLILSNGYYRLDAASPAIDASQGVYPTDTDFDGQTRTSPNDVGCDEYSTNAVMITPLSASMVGPNWMNICEMPCVPISVRIIGN